MVKVLFVRPIQQTHILMLVKPNSCSEHLIIELITLRTLPRRLKRPMQKPKKNWKLMTRYKDCQMDTPEMM